MLFIQKNSPLLHPNKHTINITALCFSLCFSRNNRERVKNNVTGCFSYQKNYQKHGFFYIRKSINTSHICDHQQNKVGQKGHKGYLSLVAINAPVLILAQPLMSESIARGTDYTLSNRKISNNIKLPSPMTVLSSAPSKMKRKIKGVLGKIYVSTTKNNTIITLVDNKNNTKGWSCSGSLGFKNARKSTTYAAQAAAENIVKKVKVLGYTHLRLIVKGLGRGKQSCLRALSKSGLKIISIEDKTGIPYNGCRLSKKRRV